MQDEEVLGKAYDSKLMKRLIEFIKPHKKYIYIALPLLCLTSVGENIGPFLTKEAIDNYIANGDLGGLAWIAGLFLIAVSVTFVSRFGQTYFTNLMGQKIMYDLRVKLFKHVQNLSLKYFDKNPVGRVMTRLTSDVEALNELFSSGLVTVFGDVFSIAIITGMLFYLDWKLALITFTVFPILFYVTFLFKKRVRFAFREVKLRTAVINSQLQENISGMNVVQLFNREERNYENFVKENNELLDSHVKTIFNFAIFFPGVEFINSIAISMIIWFGGVRNLESTLTFGTLVAFIQYTQVIFRPIRDLSEKYNILQGAMASSERIFTVFDTEPKIINSPNPIIKENFQGEIEFKNVWFAYEGEDWVLKDVSFKVEAGESLALVGATGSGKSTIISLLCRFYDIQKGEIFVDGVSLKDLDVLELRKNISLVLQDVFLFSESVLNNIRLGNSEISEAQIVEVAKKANAHDFISKLSDGYKTQLRERGSLLSTGQKQLISFARALAFDPKILVLDEATSNIDTETESLIQDAVHELMQNRTSIIVAHRLSTIQEADKILVLHKGKVREIGNHQELLANKNIYYKLYRLQYNLKVE
ncbi:MAG: ABC transporter ATP-binding protein [Calditrichaeota bacterium]|nr:MAG: ABC transporter ATP-binding protein [Calditrichota bacterium]